MTSKQLDKLLADLRHHLYAEVLSMDDAKHPASKEARALMVRIDRARSSTAAPAVS